MTQPARQYRGRSSQERAADRRARLLEAGLQLFGTVGDKATMTAICAEAKLTERYFYESFRSRDDLLVQVIEGIAEEVREAAHATLQTVTGDPEVRARAAIATFVEILTEDPRKGRVSIIESAGAEPLRTRRRQLLRAFASMVAEESKALYGDRAWSSPQDEITALLFVGGLSELITAWLNGEIEVSPEQIVDAATYQFTSTAHR
ncbi:MULTISPECIES: TetR/AcrR family transcriptional regulator [Rhodococcus]|uniref:TetR family transcriptional regulator n=1 Tax=Rhodococcus oxybenzonivorans TaxID=1990687 RepID=A0AAE5A6E8_9NOCA|nr:MULTISPECIES: TetR family transcriptional regulator [Rhodococcus]MDV7246408.1 TetR family transcriptional regulator [Rhodococcus oxybenzonivorans]MDV7265133.1 TetR family transcriptional regulator [Rhodococcus oxybenzonivorans]MDV7278003.1 TetR family transcriptional regulator [Rhodococcus oxybenzonivorans]MDV7337420.1 TetR family transcriptional regulator [Rhodococcus oxybenzonivorans]MDV7347525.1 TetR family transcriptional regulator [Rhodococcus oxybenzonivorans]